MEKKIHSYCRTVKLGRFQPPSPPFHHLWLYSIGAYVTEAMEYINIDMIIKCLHNSISYCTSLPDYQGFPGGI